MGVDAFVEALVELGPWVAQSNYDQMKAERDALRRTLDKLVKDINAVWYDSVELGEVPEGEWPARDKLRARLDVAENLLNDLNPDYPQS